MGQSRKKNKNKDSDAFSEVEHRNDNPAAGLLCLLQCVSEKKPPTSYPAAKHPNHNKLRVSRIREKPVIFSIVTYQDDMLAPTKTLVFFKSLGNVSVPVKSTIH